MYIKSSEYLSKFTGQQIDQAIETMRDYSEELEQKVDKTTTVNGQPLSDDVVITAEDIGALSNTVSYGASLDYNNGILGLVDQRGVVMAEKEISPVTFIDWSTD